MSFNEIDDTLVAYFKHQCPAEPGAQAGEGGLR